MKILKSITPTLLLFCFVTAVVFWNNRQHYRQVTMMKSPIQEERKLKEVVILLYTEFFEGPWYLRWNEKYPCAFDCKFTYKKSALTTANAVGFHDADLPLALPKRTKRDQIWFYMNLESPVNSKTKEYKNVFNWTMSYRTDSDVFAPYGDYEPLTCSESLAIESQSKTNIAQNKTKFIAWLSSNCQDSIGRFEYVKKLSSYVKVDIYGKCGNLSCTRGTSSRLSQDCKQELKSYKFYLAFENSLCYDYISEKYWENALENELVPIVMGGADYNRIAIPGSFINVENFETVEDLAEYLKYLDQNDTAYNEYFQWKNVFKLSTPYTYGCTLCSVLHSGKAKQFKVYPSLKQFWIEDKCRGSVIIK